MVFDDQVYDLEPFTSDFRKIDHLFLSGILLGSSPIWGFEGIMILYLCLITKNHGLFETTIFQCDSISHT
jgi:hypothetical protein